VCWIGAPAGEGKTVLAQQAVEHRKGSAVFLRLGPTTVDLASFTEFFVRAYAEQVGAGALPGPGPESLGNPAAYLAFVLRAALRPLKHALTIVLDDFHAWPDLQQSHAHLFSVIRELSDAPVHWIVTSRQAPPPAAARLVAERHLVRLPAASLRLDHAEFDEVARLVGLTGKLEMTKAESARLFSLTEGWVTALILVAEHARFSGRVDVDLPARGGLLDYFMTESFAQLPEERQKRMAQLSLLPEIPLSVAETILGPSIPAELAELHKQNFFLSQRTTATGPCYRFHDLYRAFLRDQVPRLLDDVVSFEQRAAQAFLAAGDGLSAIELLLQSGDFGAAAEQIEVFGFGLVQSGQTEKVKGWIAALPEPQRSQRPLVRVLAATATLPSDWRAARAQLLSLLSELHAAELLPIRALAWSVLLESKWLEWTAFSDVDEWLGAVHEFRHRHGELPPPLEFALVRAVATAMILHRPDHPDMDYWLEAAWQQIRGPASYSDRVQLASNLMFYYTWATGDRARADAVLRTLEAAPATGAVPPLARVIWHSFEASRDLFFDSTLDRCLASVEAALSVSDESGVHIWDALALNPALYCCFGFDDTTRGEHYLGEFRRRVQGERDLDRAFYLHFTAYRDWLLGRTTAAEQQLRDAIRAADEAGLLYAIIYYRIGLSRVLADRGAIEEAHAVLAEAEHSAARVGGELLRANLGLVRASIAVVAGADPNFQELAFDLERAARNGYVILPWVCRADWSELAARAFSIVGPESRLGTWLAQLVRTRSLCPPPAVGLLSPWPWPVRVLTCGGLRIEVDGTDGMTGRKTAKRLLQLLGALVMAGGQGEEPAVLVDKVWPDADEAQGTQSLHTALHRLRQLLGHPEAVITRGGRIGLNRALCWVDAWALDALSRASEESRKRARPLFGKLAPGPVHLCDDSIEALTYAAHVERLRDAVLAAH
jgi:hypothetical protein